MICNKINLFEIILAAPEILSNQNQYTNKVDIWSAGVVLYAMLSGCMPFHENNNKTISLNNQIINGQYTFPPDSFAHVSTSAIRFIQAMLQVNPNARMSASNLLRRRWMKDPENDDRLQKLYDEMIEDENDATLTEDIEKTLENVAIDDKKDDDDEIKNPTPAKRPRLMM